MHGADAEDMLIPVPPGTIIRRKDAQEDEAPLAELVRCDRIRGKGVGTYQVGLHLWRGPCQAMKGEHSLMG